MKHLKYSSSDIILRGVKFGISTKEQANAISNSSIKADDDTLEKSIYIVKK